MPLSPGLEKRDVEWIVARVKLPAVQAGGPELPEMFLVLAGPRWGTIAARALLPHEIGAGLGALFEDAATKPVRAEPHLPAAIRTACPEAAEILRGAIDHRLRIRVVCAATPEADPIAREMIAKFTEGVSRGAHRRWLREGLTAAEVGSYFRAAATYHRRRAWEIFGDQHVFFSIEELGIERWVLSAPLAASGGLFLFPKLGLLPQHYERLACIEDTPDVEPPPPVEQVLHDRASEEEIAEATRSEIEQHGWEIAAPDCYPQACYVDANGESFSPDRDHLALLEATMLAAVRLTDQRRAQGRGPADSDEGLFADCEVVTARGAMTVTFVVPPQKLLDAVKAAQRSLN